jgi:hypothetical protein
MYLGKTLNAIEQKQCNKAREALLKGRLSTVGLLVETTAGQLLFSLKIFFT